MQEKTVNDVIEELRMQGIVISLSNACRLINNAVSELTTMYDNSIVPTELEISAEAGEPYMLETMGIKSIKHNGMPYTNYKADPQSIIFNDSGDFQATVVMIPDDVSAKDDDIPVHTAFHPAVIQYVAYHAQPIGPDGKPKDNEMFYAMAQTANSRLSRTKRSRARVPARIWR